MVFKAPFAGDCSRPDQPAALTFPEGGKHFVAKCSGKKVGLMTPVYTIPVIVKICEVQGGECNWCMIDSI